MTHSNEDGAVTQTQEDGGGNGHLGFETFKHLTTLNAGSIVVIGTFLSNIFPKDDQGNLSVGLAIKLLIVASFVFFGLSLAFSAYAMYAFADIQSFFQRMTIGILGSTDRYEQELSFMRPIAGTLFFFGLVSFGVAVVLNLLW